MFWGAEFLFCLVLVVLFFSKGIDEEAFPPLIIAAYMLLINNMSYTEIQPSLAELQPYFLSLSPVCLFGVSQFRKYLVSTDKYFISRAGFLGSLAVCSTLILTHFITDISMQTINVFVTVPYLVIGVGVQLFSCFVSFLKTDSAYSGIFAAALATFTISISHDLLSRIGFLDNLIMTTGLGIPLLFFSIGTVFSGKIAGDQKALAKSNANLLLRLDENTRKLNEDFSRISKLNAEKVLATETARLHAELHDGVLTYLSMINAMTEESADDKIKSVNVLARNASTEIRVIVEAETIQRMSLFSALSTFRQRVADPLIFLNVTVDWDLRPLQHYNLSDPSVIMGVVRIFQEALHNAVERAKCRDLRVSAEWLAGDRLQVTILNQGGATLKESDTRGIGIRSMKNRAAAIGAKISLRPYPSGAILELVLPNHVSAS